MMYTGEIMKIDSPRYYLYFLYTMLSLCMVVGLFFAISVAMDGYFGELGVIAASVFSVFLVLLLLAGYGTFKDKAWGRVMSIIVNVIIVLLCLSWMMFKWNWMGHGKPTFVEGVLGVLVISIMWVEVEYWKIRNGGG